jgi:hypothetical protein
MYIYCCKIKCVNSCDISDICSKLNVTTNYRNYTINDIFVIKQHTLLTISDTHYNTRCHYLGDLTPTFHVQSDMDKSWMTLGKTPHGKMSQQYFDGVKMFLDFAKAVGDLNGNIPCLCKNCVNFYRQTPKIVRIHLLQCEIMQSYTKWFKHGEPRVLDDSHDHEMSDTQSLDGIDVMVEDRVRGESIDMQQDEEVHKFDKLLDDTKREVYPGCTNYTLLKFIIEMLNVKVMTNLSNKGLDMILDLLIKLLPKGNLVPRSTYEAKKILRDMGLSYKYIHACKNDYALFWKENANLDVYPVCKESRYKVNHVGGTKIAYKVLRYLDCGDYTCQEKGLRT